MSAAFALLATGAALTERANAGPTTAADGSLRYAFGSRLQPTLKCEPLFICDITLEGGERVINVAIGDSTRWLIAPGQSGPDGSTPHVFVKPTEAGLSTNVVITTDRRVYVIRLASSTSGASSRLSFSYPDEAQAAKSQQVTADQRRHDEAASTLPVLPPDKLDYNYTVRGAREIAPQRVYSDGVHTFVEYAALPTDLPALYAVAPDGSDQVVNFRLRDRVFVIDGIQPGFDLVLNAGTGKHGRGELRVSIRHT